MSWAPAAEEVAMLRLSLCSLMVLALACAPYETVGTRTYLGYSVGVSNAPPPPSYQVVFVQEPSLMLVPGTSVYVVENSGYDVFRYGGYTYLSSGGYWYRSQGYNRPFRVVDVRSVPQPVLTVPGDRWKKRWTYARDDHRWKHRGRDRNRDRDD
jgi:hypothetical protein